MPIHESYKLNGHKRKFPIQKEQFFRKVKENKGLRGGVLRYVALATLKFDAEIAEKGHLWIKLNIYQGLIGTSRKL